MLSFSCLSFSADDNDADELPRDESWSLTDVSSEVHTVHTKINSYKCVKCLRNVNKLCIFIDIKLLL